MLNDSRKFPVAKVQLLAKIRENREAHLKNYDEAVEAYRKEVIDALTLEIDERAAQRARARDEQPFAWEFKSHRPVKPTSYLDSYDRVIGLLELTSSTEIEISGNDYRCYIEDEWDWKEEFRNSTMSYNEKNVVGRRTNG